MVFQLAVSIGLLGCTFIIGDQLEFVQTRDLGLNEEQVVVVPIRDAPIPESREATYWLNDTRGCSPLFAMSMPASPASARNRSG